MMQIETILLYIGVAFVIWYVFTNFTSLTEYLTATPKMIKLIRLQQQGTVGQYLNVAEIQAFDLDGNNVASKKINPNVAVTLSKQYGDPATYGPDKLVDDNLGTFAETTNDRNAFMQVDLGAGYAISKIVIVNRQGSGQAYMAGAWVRAYEDKTLRMTDQKQLTGTQATYEMNIQAPNLKKVSDINPKQAVALGAWNMSPWKPAAFIDKTAKWIWNSSSAATTADTTTLLIFKQQLYLADATPNQPAVIHVLVDDFCKVYHNGVYVGSATGGWTLDQAKYPQIPITLRGGNNVFEFYTQNNGGSAGLLAAVVNSKGNWVVHSDENWLVCNQQPPNIAAGGTCVNADRFGFWQNSNSTFGGATCDASQGFGVLNCPTGTTKGTIFRFSNSGRGGESAVCSAAVANALPTTTCMNNVPNIWDPYEIPANGATCNKASTVWTSTCPPGTNPINVAKMSNSSKGGVGTICSPATAGGVCLNNAPNVWDPYNETVGGATCNTTNPIWSLVCPAGTTKKPIWSFNRQGRGGEGGICV